MVFGLIGGLVGVAQYSSERRAGKLQAAAAAAQALANKKTAYGQAFDYRQRAAATKYNISVSKENRKIAEMKMEDIVHRTKVAIANRQVQGREIEGTQIAQMYASGSTMFGATSQKVLNDTRSQTQKDVITMLNNQEKALYEGRLGIWSARTQETLMRRSARNDEINAVFAEATGQAAIGAGAQTAGAYSAAANAKALSGLAGTVAQLNHYYTRQV